MMILSSTSSSLIHSIMILIKSLSLGFSELLGIPGESMAYFPSISTSLASCIFFLRPNVPIFSQKEGAPSSSGLPSGPGDSLKRLLGAGLGAPLIGVRDRGNDILPLVEVNQAILAW